jgi:hypothetical protein
MVLLVPAPAMADDRDNPQLESKSTTADGR